MSAKSAMSAMSASPEGQMPTLEVADLMSLLRLQAQELITLHREARRPGFVTEGWRAERIYLAETDLLRTIDTLQTARAARLRVSKAGR